MKRAKTASLGFYDATYKILKLQNEKNESNTSKQSEVPCGLKQVLENISTVVLSQFGYSFFVDTITKYRNEHLFMRFFHTAQPQSESLRLRLSLWL